MSMSGRIGGLVYEFLPTSDQKIKAVDKLINGL